MEQHARRREDLAMQHVSLIKEDRLLESLDNRMLNKRNIEQTKEVATMAKRCVSVSGEERPTTSEVAM